MTAEQGRDLLGIVEDRYGRASTLLTSRSRSATDTMLSASRPSPTPFSIASVQRIELKGDSLRKRPRTPS